MINKLMAFRGKRKRSEKAKSQQDTRRLKLLGLLYALFLIPCILNAGILLVVIMVVLLALSVLAFHSTFILRDKHDSSGLLASLMTTGFTVLAWVLLTAAAGMGLLMWANFLAVYTSSLDEIITSTFIVLTVIPSVCIPFTYDLQIQMIEWLAQLQQYFAEQKQQPVFATERVEDELEAESDIPLELLAEAESAEQVQR
jgi:hypothetical protein